MSKDIVNIPVLQARERRDNTPETPKLLKSIRKRRVSLPFWRAATLAIFWMAIGAILFLVFFPRGKENQARVVLNGIELKFPEGARFEISHFKDRVVVKFLDGPVRIQARRPGGGATLLVIHDSQGLGIVNAGFINREAEMIEIMVNVPITK